MKYSLLIVLLSLLTLLLPFQDLVAQDAAETPNSEAVAEDLVNLTTETAEATFTTAETWLSQLVQLPQSDLAQILFILGGIILLIAGWRIYEIVILIAGFLVGASVATSLVVTNSALLNLVVLLVGGLLGAVLSVLLYYVAVFLIGAYVGVALTGGLATALALTPVSALALMAGGLLGGVLLVGLSFELLILISVLVGAQMLVLGLSLNAVWTMILAIIGVVIQLILTRAFNYTVRRRRINIFRRVTI